MLKFIFLLTFSSLFDVIYSDDMKDEEQKEVDKMDSIVRQCNETFITEMSFVASLFQNGSFPDESDKTPKCYVRCLLEKHGVMKDNGKFDLEAANTFFSGKGGTKQIDFDKINKGCAAERQETCRCEKSYSFIKCVIQKEIEMDGN